ncbi:MAG: GNAT family N-acetyltransferase [Dermatophilaceae bacterium]
MRDGSVLTRMLDADIPVLRSGRFVDVHAIAALERDVDPVDVDVMPHTPYDLSYPLGVALARWRRELLDPAFHVVVAEAPARGIVAYCVSRDVGTDVWLEHIGVARDLQGTGLAARLLAGARARHPGRELHLMVTETKARARRFYEREGWVVAEREAPVVGIWAPPMVEYLRTPAFA